MPGRSRWRLLTSWSSPAASSSPSGGRRNLLVYAFDYELGSSLLFHLEAYQHTLTGYFGAGLGFATPTTPGGSRG